MYITILLVLLIALYKIKYAFKFVYLIFIFAIIALLAVLFNDYNQKIEYNNKLSGLYVLDKKRMKLAINNNVKTGELYLKLSKNGSFLLSSKSLLFIDSFGVWSPAGNSFGDMNSLIFLSKNNRKVHVQFTNLFLEDGREYIRFYLYSEYVAKDFIHVYFYKIK